MAATISSKILARAAGVPSVAPGDMLWVTPDLSIIHDYSYCKYRDEMRRMGVPNIADPARLFVTIDHHPYTDALATASGFAEIRRDVREQGVKHFFDIGRGGISHNVPLEEGLVHPGQFLVAADTRAPALGCVGALAIAVGAGFVTTLITGRAWIRVPSTILVTLEGRPPRGVMSRDIAQWVATQIGPDRADYRVIELAGNTVAGLDIDERHTVCNGMVDIGCKSAIMRPDAVARDYLAGRGIADVSTEWTDPGAEYEAAVALDVSSLEPQIALPPSPDHTCAVREVAGRPIQQAFVGSCIAGKLEDLRAAARVLRGRKIHRDVRMLVIPATYRIYREALKEGVIDVLAEAGAMLAVGACGPCCGTVAPLADGEACVGTSTLNHPGRMGSERADIYIASAATVAASAVTGVITDPREFIG